MKVFELVPQGTLAKQDLGTSYGGPFQNFLRAPLVFIMWESLLPRPQ